jgi:hypothetical protein
MDLKKGVNMYKLTNTTTLNELESNNRETKLKYLDECLQLILEGEFKGHALDIHNICVHCDDCVLDVNEDILTDIEDLAKNWSLLDNVNRLMEYYENNIGYYTINGDTFDLLPNDKFLIKRAIENCQ